MKNTLKLMLLVCVCFASTGAFATCGQGAYLSVKDTPGSDKYLFISDADWNKASNRSGYTVASQADIEAALDKYYKVEFGFLHNKDFVSLISNIFLVILLNKVAHVNLVLPRASDKSFPRFFRRHSFKQSMTSKQRTCQVCKRVINPNKYE